MIVEAGPAIAVVDLVKRYGTTPAVDGISFKVQPGEVYGLLGENGAGKTTTVEILEGYRTPTSGTVSVLGCDPGVADRSFRDRIGIVLQAPASSAC
jgi:ABC-2 type transport system ATP-binding protein